MDYHIITTAEEGVRRLESDPPSGDRFELAISDSFTFAGKPDKVGFGMALLLRRILKLRYEPDGFDQNDGFKLYRYKMMKSITSQADGAS
jgi:hypothetical protein